MLPSPVYELDDPYLGYDELEGHDAQLKLRAWHINLWSIIIIWTSLFLFGASLALTNKTVPQYQCGASVESYNFTTILRKFSMV